MVFQGSSEVQRGFAQQSICFQGVVAPNFEIHLCVWSYIPRES